MAKRLFCPHCGAVGPGKMKTQGSCLVEIVLWAFFIIPGLIYSLWRITSGRGRVCGKCENPGLIPADSPIARKVLGR